MSSATRPALYSETIRERWRRPRFRGELPGATATAEDVNPLCGDRVRMQVKLDGGRVSAARFAGDSCAICTASADVPATGATTSSPASRSGSASAGPPSSMTRRWPSRSRTRTALLAGVSIASSGSGNPRSRMIRA